MLRVHPLHVSVEMTAGPRGPQHFIAQRFGHSQDVRWAAQISGVEGITCPIPIGTEPGNAKVNDALEYGPLDKNDVKEFILIHCHPCNLVL